MANLLKQRDEIIKKTYENFGLKHELLLILLDEINMEILRIKFNSSRKR